MSPRISKYLKRTSDRDGFDGFRISMVKDGPFIVKSDERDTPPPSRKSTGGEGDIARGESAVGSSNPTIYITADGGISPSFAHPWMVVTGSNSAVTITRVPQITRGRQGQLLTLHSIDSAITLTHGSANAINFTDSRGSLMMRSGMVVTFLYTTANQAWNSTSIGYV